MIRYADEGLKPDIKRIWKECFHDEDAYIDFFFSEYFNEKTTLVYINRDKVVSMLTLMPAKLQLHTKSMDIYYIYAVATLPEYQGKGYSSKLLEYVNKDKNDATFLLPASKYLEEFYEKNGYEKSIMKNSIILNENDIKEMVSQFPLEKINLVQELSEADAQLYREIRDKSMAGKPYIEWSNKMIAYAIKENARTGGKTVLINEKYIAMYREYEGVMYIREHTMPDYMIISFIQYLINSLECKEFNISVNNNTMFVSRNEQVVMSKFHVPERNIYFNLAFE